MAIDKLCFTGIESLVSIRVKKILFVEMEVDLTRFLVNCGEGSQSSLTL